MKKFNWLLIIVLSAFTCGIYGIYAMYCMTKNQNQVAPSFGEKAITGYITAWLLGIVTCGIYTMVWMYMFIDQQVRIARAANYECTPSNSPLLIYIIYFLVAPLGLYMVCENHNKTVDVYNQHQQQMFQQQSFAQQPYGQQAYGQPYGQAPQQPYQQNNYQQF